MNNTNKGGKIVLLIFILICSGLGISAFVMSLTKCKKDNFQTSVPSINQIVELPILITVKPPNAGPQELQIYERTPITQPYIDFFNKVDRKIFDIVFNWNPVISDGDPNKFKYEPLKVSGILDTNMGPLYSNTQTLYVNSPRNIPSKVKYGTLYIQYISIMIRNIVIRFLYKHV